MLPREHRLTEAAGFAGAVRRGRRAGGRLLVVHLRPDVGDDEPVPGTLVGFIVSRAVGSAVVRNRVKRRLRHLVRARLSGLPTGSVVVVRAQPGAATASYGELGTDLDRCLGRVLDDGPGDRRPDRVRKVAG